LFIAPSPLHCYLRLNHAGILEANPELVRACAAAPPKKDDGQSPLQVAFKTGNFEIADRLIGMGADVNFQETSKINEWTAPVLHDALRAAAFNARKWEADDPAKFEKAIALVRRLLQLGADPNATDSYGNTCLLRALADARQRLVADHGFPARVENETLKQDLRQIFQALIDAVADIDKSSSKRDSARAFAREPALAQLLS
jgi:ankyrin repeat protein